MLSPSILPFFAEGVPKPPVWSLDHSSQLGGVTWGDLLAQHQSCPLEAGEALGMCSWAEHEEDDKPDPDRSLVDTSECDVVLVPHMPVSQLPVSQPASVGACRRFSHFSHPLRLAELVQWADLMKLSSVVLVDQQYLLQKGGYDESKALEELQASTAHTLQSSLVHN